MVQETLNSSPLASSSRGKDVFKQIISDEKCQEFRLWLKLDEESITWQGRYQEEFENFWTLLFSAPLELGELDLRLDYFREHGSQGPLVSWFQWVQSRLYVFSFINFDLSISSISKITKKRPQQIATILRDYFVDKVSFEQDLFDEVFEVTNLVSENLDLKFSNLKEMLPLNPERLNGEEVLMSSIEVTLYSSWESVLKEFEEEFIDSERTIYKEKKIVNLRSAGRFFMDVGLLVGVGCFFLFLVQQGNIYYENYLADQVKILEPKFLWLDKSLSFKDEQRQEQSKKEILNEISELEEIIQSQNSLQVEREERFETESDVVLSSFGNISNRLSISGDETSRFEESNKGVGFNFRSYRYGRNRVYRLMVKSVRPDQTKIRMTELLNRYGVKQADNVIPGTEVPGGLYYNLFVPREYLGEFLYQISAQEEATLYETKTRGANPKDMNKVFIFVKKI